MTYPRFLSIPSPGPGISASSEEIAGADLLMEMRVGRAGLGDDWLYAYVPGDNGESGKWTLVGKYLEVRDFEFSLNTQAHQRI